MLFLAACAQDNELAPAEQTELFLQGGTDEVDVLWVVDDSISMTEEQGLVAAGFEAFLAALQQERAAIDLHLGVVSTDNDVSNPERGVLVGEPRWLTGEEPDFADQFRSRVRVGTAGSDEEQGLGAATLTLENARQGRPNEGFLRKDANLAVVFVSDENDCTHADDWPGDAAACYDAADSLTPLPDLIRRLGTAPVGDGVAIVSAIAGPEAAAGCATATPGFRYQTVTDQLDGLFEDVCTADYSGLMDEIARQILEPSRTFTLDRPAQPDSIEVMVDDVAMTSDVATSWWYDEEYQAIRFDGSFVPASGSEVWVWYLVER